MKGTYPLKYMTLIAAMKESDTSLLIAADSAVRETPGNIPLTAIQKLRKHQSAPLAWGCSGDTEVGDRFDAWMGTIPWPPTDWQQFSDRCADTLAELNGQVRKRATLAGGDPYRIAGTDLLVVAWFDEPQILEVDSWGKVAQYGSNAFHAIGSGKQIAYIAFATVKVFGGVTPLDKFRHLSGIATRTANDCDFPVHIWRVTPSGVTVTP